MKKALPRQAGDRDVRTSVELPPRSALSSLNAELQPTNLPHLSGYTIVGAIGAGGMGTVWRGFQLSTRREVAIKCLNFTWTASELAKRRFDREVELASRLEHPNIARIYQSGIEHGIYYYAMELINGLSLDAYVQHAKLSQHEILSLMRVVCQAIQYAHQRGVIHRDLKPANILVDADGIPHVLDFGLGKLNSRKSIDDSISLRGEWVGTPAFMSPEQARGNSNEVDTRTDIYSLGVILFQLLTSHLPIEADGGPLEVLQQVLKNEIIRPRYFNKQIGADLEAILLKSLAGSPDKRYGSACDLADDIGNYLQRDPVKARRPTTFYFLRKKILKHRVPIAFAVVVVVSVVTLAARGLMQVAHDRDLAIASANHDRALRQAAELRESDNLVLVADSLSSENRGADARDRYLTARDIQRSYGYFPTAAEIGLLEFYKHYPQPLWTYNWSTPIVGLHGRFFPRFERDGKSVWWPTHQGTVVGCDTMTGGYLAEPGERIVDDTVLATACLSNGDRTQLCFHIDDETQQERYSVKQFDLLSVLKSEVRLKSLARSDCVLSPGGGQVGILQTDSPERAGHQRLIVYDIAHDSYTELPKFNGDNNVSISFSPDGTKLVTSTQMGQILIWKTDDGALAETSNIDYGRNHDSHNPISCAQYSQDGNSIIVADDHGNIGYVGSIATRGYPPVLLPGKRVMSLAVSPDGKSGASSDETGVVYLWDLQSGALLHGYSTDASIIDFRFSLDNRWLWSADRSGRLNVWPIDLQTTFADRAALSSIRAIAVSSDERIQALGTRDRVEVIDVATGMRLRSFSMNSPPSMLVFSKDGSALFAATTAGNVLRFSVLTNKYRVGDNEPSVTVNSTGPQSLSVGFAQTIVISPNCELSANVSARGTCFVDLKTGKTASLIDHDNNLAAYFSNDGSKLLIICGGKDSKIKIVDVATGAKSELNLNSQTHSLRNAITAAAFSRDQMTVFIGFLDGQIIAMNVASGNEIWSARVHERAVRSIATSPDGYTAISGSDDGTLRLWDTQDGKGLHLISNGTSSVSAAAFSQRGDMIVCNGGPSNSTLSWDLTVPDRLEKASSDAKGASTLLASNPNNQEAIEKIIEWYQLRGLNEWAVRLLNDHPDFVPTLCSARCRWCAGDLAHAVADFKSLAARDPTGESHDYFLTCANAIETGSP